MFLPAFLGVCFGVNRGCPRFLGGGFWVYFFSPPVFCFCFWGVWLGFLLCHLPFAGSSVPWCPGVGWWCGVGGFPVLVVSVFLFGVPWTWFGLRRVVCRFCFWSYVCCVLCYGFPGFLLWVFPPTLVFVLSYMWLCFVLCLSCCRGVSVLSYMWLCFVL